MEKTDLHSYKYLLTKKLALVNECRVVIKLQSTLKDKHLEEVIIQMCHAWQETNTEHYLESQSLQ